jgi:D-aspartate ligase
LGNQRDHLRPALLADATWHGTLAAARDLGSRGVAVTLAADGWIAPARLSQFVERTVSCPSTRNAAPFMEWLLAFGERSPGHVLYATSDEVALQIAARVEALSSRFLLYSPTLAALVQILDKGRLATCARAAGLPGPETWLPRDDAEVERVGREARFPLVLKLRAPASRTKGGRGARVDRREDLLPCWRAWRDGVSYDADVLACMPDARYPMIQTFHRSAEEIYTVDGFVSRAGEMVALGCNKLLQRPRRAGPGVCFEGAPLDPEIASGIQRLCRELGYFGVLDAEFVVDGDRKLLIDFNPRFYNHMAFEVDRGLPLPWLAYLGALGDEGALARAMEACRQGLSVTDRVYVHRLSTELMLAAQSLTGAMPTEEWRRWRRWIAEHAGRITDPVVQAGDPWPGVGEVALELTCLLRHPRSYLRNLARGSTVPASEQCPGKEALRGGVSSPRAGTVTPRAGHRSLRVADEGGDAVGHGRGEGAARERDRAGHALRRRAQ